MNKILSIFLVITLALGTLTGCGGKGGGTNTGSSEKTDYQVPVAVTPTGTYEGHDNKGIEEFLGISYAAPIKKWKAPSNPTTKKEDVIKCDEWGPSCIQIKDDVEIASSWKQDYDCLDLNIWTKDVATTGKPVLVFMHGGGAWQGGTYDPLYDGENYIRNLAEGEDAIMVTINYRLGIFGSLNMSNLTGYTDEYADAINLATLDQIQALKWINENISAFGGDADNITIMGQSSGAASACTLLTIPSATKYFQKAIIESGSIFNRQISVEESEKRAEALFQILGVDSVDGLLNISDKDMAAKYDKIDKELHLDTSIPEPQRVADGNIVPLDGWKSLQNGSAKGINVMIGTTDGEYDWLASDWDNYPNAIKDPSEIINQLKVSKGDSNNLSTTWSPMENDKVRNEYLSQGEDKVLRAVDLYNDTKYRQTAIFTAEALSTSGSDVYMYYWKWAPKISDVIASQGEAAEVSPYGRAMHCMDLVFVFGTTKEGYPELAGSGDKIPEKLVEQTQSAYYAFASSGNPNNDLIPDWKTYNTDTRYTMMIGGGDAWKLVSDPRSEDRAILDQIRPHTEK